MATTPLVRFAGVHKSFDGRNDVVRNLSLDVAAGEFLTLLGPSGSGKTTTLMMLAGFESPMPATSCWAATSLARRRRPNRRGIGMVFQSYALFPHMTVAENVAFPLVARGLRGRRGASGSDAGAGDGATRRPRPPAARRSFRAGSSSGSRWRARWCSSRS